MFDIIPNAACRPHRPELARLLEKYFGNPDWKYELAHYERVYDDTFFVMNLGREEGRVNAFIDLAISTQAGLQGLIDGKLKEHDVIFYPKGGTEPAYLFFMTLLMENRQLGPHLIRGAFRELGEILRAWKINISHVYTMAYTKVSERLMRRHGLKQVGLYEGHYPIMAIKVEEHPYLKALIPYVDPKTKAPFES